jgi:hypothetical protein
MIYLNNQLNDRNQHRHARDSRRVVDFEVLVVPEGGPEANPHEVDYHRE